MFARPSPNFKDRPTDCYDAKNTVILDASGFDVRRTSLTRQASCDQNPRNLHPAPLVMGRPSISADSQFAATDLGKFALAMGVLGGTSSAFGLELSAHFVHRGL
jgi:hypothetical protein